MILSESKFKAIFARFCILPFLASSLRRFANSGL